MSFSEAVAPPSVKRRPMRGSVLTASSKRMTLLSFGSCFRGSTFWLSILLHGSQGTVEQLVKTRSVYVARPTAIFATEAQEGNGSSRIQRIRAVPRDGIRRRTLEGLVDNQGHTEVRRQLEVKSSESNRR